ncbi:MAG: hypothetical protein HY270_05700 [Deltaproteobacteria bacterium]|nr:hypothetical protein [Deltaproteobacteria bacterium]
MSSLVETLKQFLSNFPKLASGVWLNAKGIVIAVLISLAFLVPGWVIGWVVTPWGIFRHYVNTVAEVTGLNLYLVSALSTVLFIPFYYGYSLLISPLSKRRRYAGASILGGMFVLYNLGLYSATKKANFSFGEGKAIKWYAITPDGLYEADREGTDPKYGLHLTAVTPDMAEILELVRQGPPALLDPHATEFFNANTGRARSWYSLDEDDNYRFFDRPGYDPRSSAELKPVTHAVVDEWRKRDKEKAAAVGGNPNPIDPKTAVFFNPVSGKPQVWYHHDPDGTWEFFGTRGFHPRTGAELKEVTAEVVEEWRTAEQARAASDPAAIEQAKVNQVDPRSVVFFNPTNGQPFVWCGRGPSGRMEFFDRKGVHPLTGAPLQPVTQEILARWRTDEQRLAEAAKPKAPAPPHDALKDRW